MAGYDIGSLLGPKKPEVNTVAGAYLSQNIEEEAVKKKDNPADPSSLAARLSSGNVC